MNVAEKLNSFEYRLDCRCQIRAQAVRSGAGGVEIHPQEQRYSYRTPTDILRNSYGYSTDHRATPTPSPPNLLPLITGPI
jgi:hypothetical protein